jgi:cytochrome P450
LYFLACNPTAYQRLQKEVDEAAVEGEEAFNNDTSPSLPYLEAVITETLRLKPNVPSGQPRVTPTEGLVIDGTWIPGDTIVIIPQYVIQRDERCFTRASEFLPERWLDEGKDLIVDRQAYFPFSIGESF